VTDGLAIRVVILLLTMTQACISALLGFAELLPQQWKIALVVASAGLAVALNQIPSWMNAPRADRAMRAAASK
jgi:hypothetical protein